MVARPPLIINRLDAERLQRLIDAAGEDAVALSLEEELERGEVLEPEQIPADVISMNSRVRFTDLTREREIVKTLVYPHALDATEDGVSVMAPVGAALLGLHVGDVIEEWPLPGGKQTSLRVDAILWQPEREGQFHR
ncbi:nucleoside diphosphate kinase regulator [Halomonas elongata]|uniref:Nucleoside diphosphate kinase regulator n=1 Tax=Halomonas elongata (strain ATCC 33173 / DSM 2581 / NBRC 15536 / NCIMB 2198 / 1H9) TaxID=768066 RepID=E1V6F8_HALED|nr:nucleoside diphosphate kinase regulator [Halomonas elongata]MBW5800897.1 nucleoside diphosphate kinase regulator [Halomonas elongata]MDL4861805.1 nucleoside diphosphate kinase regulator [Halomonas elongata]RAW07586.1 nucleoside diphosphate kinase regulator [Halomonas elongata]WBF18524.1 nucleoside diphosphate kinase regulator [Halomonas elongata]WPU47378.1 nucleoside diphosphate kinase regulator [Halomonas elongata DSM 2581]